MNGIYAILAFLVAWAVSHIIKVTIAWVKNGRMSFGEVVRTAFKSGGMPSGHTADMVAMSTYLGLWQGVGSAVFALAVGITIIVMYDAMNVRYAVGELGKEVNKLIGKKKKVYEGHTLPQVIVGAMIGVVVGWCVFVLTK